MATWRFVVLDFPEAQPLADLTGVEQDLEVAASFCDLLLEEQRKLGGECDKTPPNPIFLEALTVAASIRYARAFPKNQRAKRCNMMLKDVVKHLPHQLANDHQRFINFRDKYIAHSVNYFEENLVVGTLVPQERGSPGVASVSVQHNRLLSLGVEDAKCLKTLCVEMGRRISDLIEAEMRRVLEIARQLPIDALYSRVNPPPRVAPWSDVRERRSKWTIGWRPLKHGVCVATDRCSLGIADSHVAP